MREYGYGRFGTTRVHYRPSPKKIEEVCRQIREKGYTDSRGEWHPPWDEVMEEERRTGCYKTQSIDGLDPIPTGHIRKLLEDEEGYDGDWFDMLLDAEGEGFA